MITRRRLLRHMAGAGGLLALAPRAALAQAGKDDPLAAEAEWLFLFNGYDELVRNLAGRDDRRLGFAGAQDLAQPDRRQHGQAF